VINVRHYTTIMSKTLREGKCGRFSLEKEVIPKGTLLRTYTPAGFFYRDKFNRDFPVVKLKEEGGQIWMSDTPLEQEALRMPTMLASGDVLVIGLGIGLLPMLLKTRNRTVRKILIVEREPDVVDLVYNQISFTKTDVMLGEGKEQLRWLEMIGRKFDFIFIDIWGGIVQPMTDIKEWTKLAEPCLKPNGMVRCWLQELYNRVKNQLPKEPVTQAGFPGIYEPCLICGKRLRNDYAGLCMDCADTLGLSEMFRRAHQRRAGTS